MQLLDKCLSGNKITPLQQTYLVLLDTRVIREFFTPAAAICFDPLEAKISGSRFRPAGQESSTLLLAG